MDLREGMRFTFLIAILYRDRGHEGYNLQLFIIVKWVAGVCSKRIHATSVAI